MFVGVSGRQGLNTRYRDGARQRHRRGIRRDERAGAARRRNLAPGRPGCSGIAVCICTQDPLDSGGRGGEELFAALSQHFPPFPQVEGLLQRIGALLEACDHGGERISGLLERERGGVWSGCPRGNRCWWGSSRGLLVFGCWRSDGGESAVSQTDGEVGPSLDIRRSEGDAAVRISDNGITTIERGCRGEGM